MPQIRGAFPLPLAQIAEGGGVVCLGSGGTFYFNSGEYVVTLGTQTVLQVWDPINQVWRGVQQPAGQVDFIAADGYNMRLLNISGTVAGALITAAGSGGTNGIGSVASGTSVAFSAPAGGAPATASGYAIVGGSVQAPLITQGGSGFIDTPTVFIDPPPPGGIQATAISTLTTAGVVNGITMVNVGAGYAASPNFYVEPQPALYQGGPSGSLAAGSLVPPGLVFPGNAVTGNPNTSPVGCQLTSQALTGSGTLTGIVVVDPGNAYTGTNIPSVTISGGGLTAATATAIMSFCLTSVTLGSGGAGYTGTAPIFETSLGLIAAASNNAVYQPRRAIGRTTIGGGAVATFVIEDPGFGLQSVPTVSVLNAGSLATGQATGTAVVGGVNDFSLVQPRVQ